MARANECLYSWNQPNTDVLSRVRVEEDTRDALQSVRATRPSIEQRKQLLELSAKVGVQVAFLGFPAASARELEECAAIVAHIAERGLPIEPVLMARALEADVHQILDIQQRSSTAITADIYIATSALRMHVEGWTLNGILEKLRRASRFASTHGLRFRIAFEDSTRTAPHDLTKAVEEAIHLGARCIVINDTVGDCLPDGATRQAAFVREVIERNRADVELAWHGHNDKGLSLANALAAVQAGATIVSGTFMGVGERTGNIPLEQLILLLCEAGSNMYDLRYLVPMCELFTATTGIEVPANLPVVGSDAFSTATGTHAAAILKARTLGPDFEDLMYSGVSASQLGREQTLLIGPNSGRSAIRAVLESLSIPANDETVSVLLDHCKRCRRTIAGGREIRQVLQASEKLLCPDTSGTARTHGPSPSLEPPAAASTRPRAGSHTKFYTDLDAKLNEATGSVIGLPLLVGACHHRMPASALAARERNHAVIRDYQRIVVRLWLNGTLPDAFRTAATWSAPVPTALVSAADPEQLLPSFFRTDESHDGRIFEIQCPGSWWGTYQALEEATAHKGGSTLAERFAAEVDCLLPEGANILHLFESSGVPHQNQFFAQRVRKMNPAIRFWGIDDISSEDCNFIRAHSYPALVAEDLFRARLQGFVQGKVRFDHPPIPVFDHKLTMCLPYHPQTAGFFSAEHRQLFPYTTVVDRDSVRLETGDVVSFMELARLSAEDRPYYLKYAGGDTTRNFGAKGVFSLRRLSSERLAALLETITADYDAGEFWILQRDAGSIQCVEYLAEDGTISNDYLHTKLASFYGPTGCLGVLFQASSAPEVHWTRTTVASLVAFE